MKIQSKRWRIPVLALPWLAATIAWPLGAAAATTRAWTGSGTDALASTAANWSGATAPVTGDHVRFDDSHTGNTWTNATWDLNIAPSSWTQTVAYAGTVTIETQYPVEGGFTNLVITGDVTLEGGIWTHPQNSGGDLQVNRLCVAIAGDFMLVSPAAINVDARGYAPGRGPGRGSSANSNTQPAASHGGMGGAAFSATYGSIEEPIDLGSGAYSRGGGAVRLVVQGHAEINGAITAEPGLTGLARGSGGSIWLTTATLAGDGLLNASVPYNGSASPQRGGGGGRIAVHLTAGSSFGDLRMQAYGGRTQYGIWGAAGTVYLQTQSQAGGTGSLTIDNGGYYTDTQTLLTPEQTDLDGYARVVVTNRALLALNANTSWAMSNLAVAGAVNSFIYITDTNNLNFGTTFVMRDYTLIAAPHLTFANLTITNGVLRMHAAGPAASITVSGDMIIAGGGVLTHQGANELFRLILDVGNDLIIETGGRIDADGVGFAAGQGPGRGSSANSNTQPAASHGGQGTPNPGVTGQPVTYGSVLQPVRFGSGAYTTGGGAIRATVGGMTRIDGQLSAQPSDAASLAAGAGGSIWLSTAYLEGSGAIEVKSRHWSTSTAQRAGGGGRIAVYVRHDTVAGAVTLNALGGRCLHVNRAPPGAAGTIYVETAADPPGWGTIRIDNYHTTWNSEAIQSATNIATQLPPATEWPEEDLSWTKLEIDRLARGSLTSDLTLRDLYILHEDARLHLNGHTLRLRAAYHSDWGSTHNVVYDGGEIIWSLRGTILQVR